MTIELHGPVVVGMDGSEEAMRAAGYGVWDSPASRPAAAGVRPPTHPDVVAELHDRQ